jgi:hypothetical protein
MEPIRHYLLLASAIVMPNILYSCASTQHELPPRERYDFADEATLDALANANPQLNQAKHDYDRSYNTCLNNTYPGNSFGFGGGDHDDHDLIVLHQAETELERLYDVAKVQAGSPQVLLNPADQNRLAASEAELNLERAKKNAEELRKIDAQIVEREANANTSPYIPPPLSPVESLERVTKAMKDGRAQVAATQDASTGNKSAESLMRAAEYNAKIESLKYQDARRADARIADRPKSPPSGGRKEVAPIVLHVEDPHANDARKAAEIQKDWDDGAPERARQAHLSERAAGEERLRIRKLAEADDRRKAMTTEERMRR